ncbi:hypothetical protein BRADI_2g25875v3 [Brachypodium distachyon]|uniref:Uncharacterized protein n=1 Tax=Brachypodium distachyon TaxID=15368 RepID=A0A0Q3IKJ6_BRADI|nr:hypothetical protein BRADI_2g25875v3 [Brachypodium distachyon]
MAYGPRLDSGRCRLAAGRGRHEGSRRREGIWAGGGGGGGRRGEETAEWSKAREGASSFSCRGLSRTASGEGCSAAAGGGGGAQVDQRVARGGERLAGGRGKREGGR